MVDVVSLYPSVMYNENCFYPRGEHTYTAKRNYSKLGFYHIKVKHLPNLPNVLPKRDYEGTSPLDWNCKEEFETWCCSIDLDVLEKHGHYYKVIEGIEFADRIGGHQVFSSQRIFKNQKILQDVLKDSKDEVLHKQYNESMRNVCKLYLNSLSGKVIQRNFDSLTYIVKSDIEVNKFIDNCVEGTVTCHRANNKFCVLNGKNKAPYTKSAKPSYLGVYIYAHARALMYDSIFSKVECHYTDTDSALIYYEDYTNFRQQNPHLFKTQEVVLMYDKEGNAINYKPTENCFNKTLTSYKIKPFGTLDCEMKEFDSEGNWVGADEAYLLAPKNYMVCNKQTNYYPKVKCKGVSFKGSYCE